jgi:hypothetical protein
MRRDSTKGHGALHAKEELPWSFSKHVSHTRTALVMLSEGISLSWLLHAWQKTYGDQNRREN